MDGIPRERSLKSRLSPAWPESAVRVDSHVGRAAHCGRSPSRTEPHSTDRVVQRGQSCATGAYTTNSSGSWSSLSRFRERQFVDLLSWKTTGLGSSSKPRGRLRGKGLGRRAGRGRTSSRLRLCSSKWLVVASGT